jgi:hypothetical protein
MLIIVTSITETFIKPRGLLLLKKRYEMLVFGVDIPLVEIVFTLAIVIFILLIEAIVVIALLVKQLNKTKKLGELVEKLSETILLIKKAEIEQLDKLKKK